MDTIGQIFGAVLYERRKQKGLTQEKLAEKSDVDRKYIYLLEKGRRQPTLQTILALSKALSLTPMELIEDVFIRIEQKK